MPLDRLTASLRRVLGTRVVPASAERRDAVERRLVTLHQARYRDHAGGGGPVSPWPGLTLAARLAIAGVAVSAAAAAACQIPVDVEVELGHRLRFEVPAGPDGQAKVESVARALEARSGAEKIELRVHHLGGATMEATLDVWGREVDVAEVEAVLAEHELDAGDVEELSLQGTIRTTWGDRLGHELFDLELDVEELDEREARQHILDELEARGFDGDAEVLVEDEAGQRKIEIRLHQEARHTAEDRP